MIDDYMLTYANYYSITKESDSARFEIIKEKNADMMLRMIIGDQDGEKPIRNC